MKYFLITILGLFLCFACSDSPLEQPECETIECAFPLPSTWTATTAGYVWRWSFHESHTYRVTQSGVPWFVAGTFDMIDDTLRVEDDGCGGNITGEGKYLMVLDPGGEKFRLVTLYEHCQARADILSAEAWVRVELSEKNIVLRDSSIGEW